MYAKEEVAQPSKTTVACQSGASFASSASQTEETNRSASKLAALHKPDTGFLPAKRTLALSFPNPKHRGSSETNQPAGSWQLSTEDFGG